MFLTHVDRHQNGRPMGVGNMSHVGLHKLTICPTFDLYAIGHPTIPSLQFYNFHPSSSPMPNHPKTYAYSVIWHHDVLSDSNPESASTGF